jgi:tetratricopeptide (TPR) repeat protein
MIRSNPFSSSTLFITVLGLLITLCVATRAFPYYGFSGWESGALGYDLALNAAQEEEKPLILYFHIDPSIWNDRMKDEYLADYEINEFLEGLPKVHINPDKGEAESAISSEYNITRYPAFLVFIPSFNTEPWRIHPFSDTDTTKEEFLNSIKDNIVYEYNNKAFECVENEDYENALRYFEIALNYDPDTAYSYYGMGNVYHLLASEQTDVEFLNKAEERYSKALEIDPEHEPSMEALKKIWGQKEE